MIAIVDYRAGNLTSVRLAFEHLGIPAVVTQSPEVVRRAERVVFPGVGSAAAAMRHLAELGLDRTLRETAASGTPLLGICLGAQIILDRSEEDGGTGCLGLLPGDVVRFRPADPREKVPHMGWNAAAWARPHPLFKDLESGSEFYFVHSYYTRPASEDCVLALTEYAGVRFASALGRANVAAAQFHPEKSGRVGLQLLLNFSRWDGRC
jgi:glutamine amidotransferase